MLVAISSAYDADRALSVSYARKERYKYNCLLLVCPSQSSIVFHINQQVQHLTLLHLKNQTRPYRTIVPIIDSLHNAIISLRLPTKTNKAPRLSPHSLPNM